MMKLSRLKRRFYNIRIYFQELPAGHAFRALVTHHELARKWLAKSMVKTVDQWVAAVLFWGLADGRTLVKEHHRNKILVTIPGFSEPVAVRPQYSDRSVFRHVFVYSTYALKTPRRDDVKWIIDAGANVGYSALFFAGQYPGAKIVAIEPNEANFQLLISNTRQCGRIKAKRGALWHEKASLAIVDPRANAQAFQVRPDSSGLVEAVTIPDIMKSENITQIDILKMDIEGAEKYIFQGDCSSWLGCVRTLLVELHDEDCLRYFEHAIKPYSFERLLCGENVFLFRREKY
jgi:FkbM family methyltransferase